MATDEADDDVPAYLSDVSSFPTVDEDEYFESKWAQIKIGSELTDEQVSSVKSLIHEFQDVFSSKPTRVNDIDVKIDLKDDTPVNVKPFSIPHACRESLKEEIDKMLELGVIQPSNSPYNSPIFHEGVLGYTVTSRYNSSNCLLNPFWEIRVQCVTFRCRKCCFTLSRLYGQAVE